ncbi:hypothetical protein F8S13_19520 [Chloroflexia bacterium SDU3-3]|nr:hypothetical protein F8S13_19520 [Chloroflexia bacterium SDU3-3]
MTGASFPAVQLHALLLADHIYQDRESGKYVISGTFHQLNVAAFPATFPRTIGLFVSMSGLAGSTDIGISLVDVTTGDTLVSTQPLGIRCDSPDAVVSFGVELPPLLLPHAGCYHVQLAVNGSVIGHTPVYAIGS